MVYTDLFWRWARWKNRYIMGVARRLMDRVRERNPDVRFAINLMYEVAYRPREAIAWLSQSLEGAKEAGFDLYAIMAYHRQIQEELRLGFSETLDVLEEITEYAVSGVEEPAKVVVKLQIMDWRSREPIPRGELEEVLMRVARRGVSIAIVPYKGYGFLKGIGMARTP